MADVGLYRASPVVKCDVKAGGATLEFELVVDATNGHVYGRGRVKQAVTPPGGDLPIPVVTGQVRHTGLGKDQLLVALKGKYGIPGPPPTIAISQGLMTAALVLDAKWNGHGSFTYGVDGDQSCREATVTNKN
ncbi:MAG TPA: DUF1842 domain-containing protein [Allosphingosinicella sp.]|jgi:hypothetical protein